MSEESKWNAYQQTKAKERMKYDKNLPEDCEGCMAGRRWTVQEQVNLIRALKQDNSISELCTIMNRPRYGILSKMTKMGLVHMQPAIGNYKYRGKLQFAYIAEVISKKRFNSMPEPVQQELIARGWGVDQQRVIAPYWWRKAVIKNDIRRHK